jgi:predicted O-methyltransferase YrrM
MTSILHDPKLESLLDRLHAQSDTQVEEIDNYFTQRRRVGKLDLEKPYDNELHLFLSDKMVALDRDKGEFCYQLCRSIGASRIIEAGTSFGVSTMYLAAAVRDNQFKKGVVIGTEHEPAKVKVALQNFEEAGLSKFIDLREGDLRETLKEVGGSVDFMLVDIWNVALPALELVSSNLRPGAIVVCDNTTVSAEAYRGYFKFINDPKNQFRTMTIPFRGGLELTVRV